MNADQVIQELQKLAREVAESKDITPGLRRTIFQGLIDMINKILRELIEA